MRQSANSEQLQDELFSLSGVQELILKHAFI